MVTVFDLRDNYGAKEDRERSFSRIWRRDSRLSLLDRGDRRFGLTVALLLTLSNATLDATERIEALMTDNEF